MNRRFIIIIGIVVLGLIGWHVGARWYILNKIPKSLEKQHRLTVVPKKLNLVALQNPEGVECNIGYATFVIPNATAIDLRSSASGVAIEGEGDSLSFAFLKPYNPRSNQRQVEFGSKIDKLPSNHPMRRAYADGDSFSMMIQIEEATPAPFIKTLLMGTSEFKVYVTQLLLKCVIPHGNAGVYTFSNPTSKGLLYLGKKMKDLRYAHIFIQNQSGNQAVGMIAQIPDGKAGNIMESLPSLLKTFRFTVEDISSEDEIRALIAKAGITPIPEEKIN